MSEAFGRTRPDNEMLGDPRSRRRRWVLALVATLAVVVLAAIIAALALIVIAKHVSGESMEPTLHDGDRFLVTGDTGGTAHRFDVVVAREPGATGTEIVKRVIAVPGDAVQIRDRFTVLVQPGHRGRWYRVMSPTWPGRVDNPSPCCNETGRVSAAPNPAIVPPGDYFLLGDNPAVSIDSRTFGWVSSDLIAGRVGLRVWPLTASRHLGNRPILVPIGNLR